jgi:CHAD domain-containing protein
MTPGLAGFIASGRDEAVWDQSVAGVIAALASEFELAPERPGQPASAGRRTWLDTFDWRLHKAGLTLEYAARSIGGELRLTVREAKAAPVPPVSPAAAIAPPPAETLITQPVTGWQAARPRLMHELPDGPVASRIGDLVAPRALLPIVTVSTETVGYRLLNSDGKTVARLLVERPAIAGRRPGPAATALPPRLTIAEVRGYPGPARRAGRVVAAAVGIAAAGEPVLAEAMRALGRRPGDYSNKVDAPISTGMPASRAAATILLRLLDTVEANVAGVLADTDTEFLHDLRVSVRRTRSALKLFDDVLTVAGPNGPDGAARSAGLTQEEVARFAAEFKWVGDLTTPTRDLDVHLLDFDDTAHSLSAAKPDELEPLRVFLEQRRRREFRILARGLRSARFAALRDGWRERLTTIGGGDPAVAGTTGRSGQGRQAAGGTTGVLAAECTRTAFAKVARRGAAITAGSPAESLHDLRKRCKELRYALEFFAPLHDRAAQARVVGDLKRLQDVLGEFQDTEVQIAEIRALATAMLAAGEGPAVTLLAMGEVTAGLVSRQRAAREDFDRRFAAFAGIDGKRRMAALLRGEAGGR